MNRVVQFTIGYVVSFIILTFGSFFLASFSANNTEIIIGFSREINFLYIQNDFEKMLGHISIGLLLFIVPAFGGLLNVLLVIFVKKKRKSLNTTESA